MLAVAAVGQMGVRSSGPLAAFIAKALAVAAAGQPFSPRAAHEYQQLQWLTELTNPQASTWHTHVGASASGWLGRRVPRSSVNPHGGSDGQGRSILRPLKGIHKCQWCQAEQSPGPWRVYVSASSSRWGRSICRPLDNTHIHWQRQLG